MKMMFNNGELWREIVVAVGEKVEGNELNDFLEMK